MTKKKVKRKVKRKVRKKEQVADLDPQSVFHFGEDEQGLDRFDALSKENGSRTWSALQLMDLLGYSSWDSFRQVINKAATACMTINASVQENFQDLGHDYKLSKFACYLVSMNGDPRKPGVAQAQGYFAAIAEAFQKYISGAEDVERVETRQRLTESEKSLSSTAAAHGVVHYGFFADKGYLGLYNMRLKELRKFKGDPSGGKRPLLDFMNRRELAANQFRVTETEARIAQGGLQGQSQLERAALSVGKAVRDTMMKAGGVAPENLPLGTDIKKVRSDLKRTHKGLKKADDTKKLEE